MYTTSDDLFDKSANINDASAVKNLRNFYHPSPVDIIPRIPRDKILVKGKEIPCMITEKERE